MINKGLMSSNTDEWATPIKFYEELNKKYNFTLDTVVFIGISFGLGFGWLWNNPIGLLNMFVGQYLVKFILAALDTPIFYLLTRKRNEE